MLDCNLKILSTILDNNSCSFTFINTLFLSSSSIKTPKGVLLTADDAILEKASKILAKKYPKIIIGHWEHFLLLNGDLSNFVFDLNDFLYTEFDELTALKTLFLTSGRFYYNQDNSINSKGYSLEFVFKDELLADFCSKLLLKFGFSLKKIKRKSAYVLYTKNSNLICDLFVTLGDGYTAMEIQNNLAMREMRNTVNRQNNCFESNLDKTILASSEQMKAIQYIMDNYSIDYLPENLRETALVRLANPEVSLNDLKTLLNNKISRAGIKYRLDKIIEIYKQMKGEQK